MLSPARLVLGELPLKSAPKHGQFVSISTVALDDPKVAHEPCVKAEEVQIVGGDLLPLGIVGGMNGMLDMMAIDREDGDPLQLREVPQEIGHRHLVSQHQLPIQLVEDMGTALLVKAVEERSAGDALVHGVAKHLEEVTTAGGL
jgi:hypothetical protein